MVGGFSDSNLAVVKDIIRMVLSRDGNPPLPGETREGLEALLAYLSTPDRLAALMGIVNLLGHIIPPFKIAITASPQELRKYVETNSPLLNPQLRGDVIKH